MEIALNTGDPYTPDDKDVINWVRLYPGIDVHRELDKMSAWCDANPTKRKTKKGIKRFIVNWLSRAQDRGGSPDTIKTQQQVQESFIDISWVPEPLRGECVPYFLNKYGAFKIDGGIYRSADELKTRNSLSKSQFR